LFECSKRVPRSEQEACVVGGGDTAAHDGRKVFELGANSDKGAIHTGIDQQQRKAGEEAPC